MMKNQKSITHAIKTTNILIAQKIHKELKLKNFGISPAQMRIIEYLANNTDKKIYQKDIEKLLKIRRSTTSGILKNMEKNKIIERKDSLVDARSKEIMLSDIALESAKKMKNKTKNFDNILHKNIDPNDLKIFFKVIEQIQENIISEEEDEYAKTI